MKVGVISDTHDNLEAIKSAYDIFKKNAVDFVVHCGDISSKSTIDYLDNSLKTYIVFGNCDDPKQIQDYALDKKNISVLGHFGHLDIDGKSILIYHGDNASKLSEFIDSLKYDYIFTGHTHVKRDEVVNNSRIINPGAHKLGVGEKNRSVAIVDLVSEDVTFHFIL